MQTTAYTKYWSECTGESMNAGIAMNVMSDGLQFIAVAYKEACKRLARSTLIKSSLISEVITLHRHRLLSFFEDINNLKYVLLRILHRMSGERDRLALTKLGSKHRLAILDG